MKKNEYTSDFFENMRASSVASPGIILDRLFTFVPLPKSAVDVGAGVGCWLKALMDRGCQQILAVEGSWVRNALTEIPRDTYHIQNLELPLNLPRKFDLAISLEVAEHLSEKRGPTFIQDLTQLADVILFSAAIPGQGGTHHVNEQWQQYWVDLFARHGYACLDVIRPAIWNDSRIRVEYRQNILLFLNGTALDRGNLTPTDPLIASLVHPHIAKHWGPGIKIASLFLWKAISKRLFR